MIVDKLKNARWYYGSGKKIQMALEWLQKTHLAGMTPGRYEIDGTNVYALVQEYTSKPRDPAQGAGKLEAHRKYIDVQYIVSGVEQIGYANTEDAKVTVPYDESKDVLFVDAPCDFVTLRAGMFMLLGPNDAHMPGIMAISSQPVRKVVVKIIVN